MGAEKIIVKLREAEVLQSQGQTVGQVCRRLGISEQTYYRWRKEYGGLRMDQAKRMKELEKENMRLRQMVADLSLDKQILKEASAFASKNF
jgi:putative transposase